MYGYTNRYGREIDYNTFLEDGYIDPDMQTLVYDFGTGMTKLGFSGDDAPRAVFPSIVGRPKNPKIMVGMDAKDRFVGDEAQAKRGILNLAYPMPNDRTEVDFEDMEKLIHHCPYNELCVTPEEHPLVFTSFYNMTFEMFNKISEILFERFNHPALYCADANVLSFIPSGKVTGVSVECGAGGITSTCIYESYPIQHSKIVLEDQLESPRIRLGGDLISQYLVKLLVERKKFGRNPTSAELEIVRDIKEKQCFCDDQNWRFIESYNNINSIQDERVEQQKNEKKKLYAHEYEMPDGSKIMVEEERFLAPEILFRPRMVGYDLPGIHELIKTSIEQIDSDLHHEMYGNICLSGGTSMFEGLPGRLKHEISEIVSGENSSLIDKISVIDERKFAAWIGGSILSSLSTFREMCVGKNKLKEFGNYRIMKEMCQMVTYKNDQIGLLKHTMKNFDQDLMERIEFVLHDLWGISTDDKEEGQKEAEFKIMIRNSYYSQICIRVDFRSLLFR